MKAVRFHEHGEVEVLRFEEVPDPRITATQVLIRVKACALNHLDIWTRKGMPGVQVPLPHISGCDVAGEVAAVGDLVTRVKPGDPVLVSPGLSCGQCPQCLAGDDNLCRHYEILGGYRRDGGYAELVAVPEVNVLPKPARLSFEDAAAIPLTFLTAWNMLVAVARLRPGEEVLVMGGGSGVGSAAIQVAKLHGARVIAAAGSDEKLAKAKALGADEGINYATQDLAKEVRRLTEKRGVDVIIEHVGAAVWEKCLPILAPGGRLVTCGATSGFLVPTDLRYLFIKQVAILGASMGSKAHLLQVLRFVERGALRPVVHRVFPLREAAAAQRTMEERSHFGKLVLTP